MYNNSAAEFRPELQTKVEEAMGVDKNFIGDLLFPIFPVATRTGQYKRIRRGKGQLLAKPKEDTLKRAPGTEYRSITRSFEDDKWNVTDRGLQEVIDDTQAQDESRFFDLEASTAIWLMRNNRIAREARVADEIFSEANWGDPIQSALAFTEANLETFDVVALMKEGKRTVKKRQQNPNTAVFSSELWDLITSSKKLASYLFGTSAGGVMITRKMFAEKFELEQILVGEASYDTTNPNKKSMDANLTWTWSNDYFWIGEVKGGAPEMGGAGRTMVLEQNTGGELFVTESIRNELARSTVYRVRSDEDIKVVDENCGVLVQVNSL